LLENSFASGPDFRSGAERAVLGRFQTDSEPLIGQAVTFAKGSHLPSSSSNALSACGRLAPFRCLSDILAYKHPLEAHLPGTIAQHSVKAELRVFCDFGIASTSKFKTTKSPDLRFRAQLTEATSETELTLV
jgi:hypothetical protein